MEYRFECPKCGYQFELFFKMIQHDDPRPKCQACGTKSMRIIAAGHPATVILKESTEREFGKTWPGKEARMYGVHGDGVGHAERVRLQNMKQKNKEDIEKSFYGDKSLRNPDKFKNI